MSKHSQTGRDATGKELREVERVLSLTPVQQQNHPSAVPADHGKLSHINTYGAVGYVGIVLSVLACCGCAGLAVRMRDGLANVVEAFCSHDSQKIAVTEKVA